MRIMLPLTATAAFLESLAILIGLLSCTGESLFGLLLTLMLGRLFVHMLPPFLFLRFPTFFFFVCLGGNSYPLSIPDYL